MFNIWAFQSCILQKHFKMVILFHFSFLLFLLLKPVFLFTYDDFTNWGATCTSGTRQSPININTVDLQSCQTKKFNITFYSGTILNQPDSAKALENFFPGGTIRNYDSTTGLLMFDSLQYHFHYPSQHRINGVRYDMQLHIVHSLNSLFQASDNLAVTGLLFQIDDSLASSDTDIIEQFKAFSGSPGDNIDVYTILNSQLAKKAFYYYLGSLTTPPCSQVVNWYVCSTVFKIKRTTYNSMKTAIDTGMGATTGNARPIQSLNGRTLRNLDNSCNAGLAYANILELQNLSEKALVSLLLTILTITLLL